MLSPQEQEQLLDFLTSPEIIELNRQAIERKAQERAGQSASNQPAPELYVAVIPAGGQSTASSSGGPAPPETEHDVDQTALQAPTEGLALASSPGGHAPPGRPDRLAHADFRRHFA